jgi:thioredoxin-related protein
MKNFLVTVTACFAMFFTSYAQDWNTNIEKAKAAAAAKNQNIILVFQGSDWCAPCIKLERQVWNTPEFKEYSKEHFVMLQADFPRKKKNKLSVDLQKHNDQLAEKYNKNGYFPLVVVLDKDGKVLGETGYKKISPSEYIKLLASFKS